MKLQIIISILLICGSLQIYAEPIDDKELIAKLVKIVERLSIVAEHLDKRLESCDAASTPSVPQPTRPPVPATPSQPEPIESLRPYLLTEIIPSSTSTGPTKPQRSFEPSQSRSFPELGSASTSSVDMQ